MLAPGGTLAVQVPSMAALPGLEDLEARRRLQITDVLPVGGDLRLLARMIEN